MDIHPGRPPFDLGYQNDTGDGEEYRQLIREATGKIFELSKELWMCKQREKDQIEKEGLIELPSHNSTGPFANTQMTLWGSSVESLSEGTLAIDEQSCMSAYQPQIANGEMWSLSQLIQTRTHGPEPLDTRSS
jgi:hypothetical protein